MNQKEHNIRAVALRVFTSREGSRESIIQMAKENPSYVPNLKYNQGWDETMEAWVQISNIRRDNPYPDEVKDGQIIIDEMEIGGRKCTIKAFQSKDGKWLQGEKKFNTLGGNWFGMTWMSYHTFFEDLPETSNTSSLKEAIYKTVTDFCIFWCEENGFNVLSVE